jgi:hypothetical protein
MTISENFDTLLSQQSTVAEEVLPILRALYWLPKHAATQPDAICVKQTRCN